MNGAIDELIRQQNMTLLISLGVMLGLFAIYGLFIWIACRHLDNRFDKYLK